MSDNPEGPQSFTVEEMIDHLEETPTPSEQDKAEEMEAPVEAEAETTEDDTIPEEAEAEAPEADDPEESEASEQDADSEDDAQVLTVDDYGDVIVEVDGQRTTIKDLADGALRRADYTRKTQEVADLKKQFEAREAEIAEKQRQLDAALLDAQQEEGLEPDPDWEQVLADDPVEGPGKLLLHMQKKAKILQARQEAEARQQAAQREFIERTASMAIEKFPEWTDTAKYQAGEDARRQALFDVGFTQAEYDGKIDMRLDALLERLVRAEAAVAGRKEVVSKAKAPKVIKPGRAKTSADQRAADKASVKRKLSRPHSIDERLDALLGKS